MNAMKKMTIQRSTRKYRFAFFGIFFFLTSAVFSQTEKGPNLPPLNPPVDQEQSKKEYEQYNQFLNVQFLNHLDRVKLERVMGFMTESLGVKCVFCHEPKDFSSGKKKYFQRSREMLRMLQFSLSNYLKNDSLTCFTCHAGSTTPSRLPKDVENVPSLIKKDKPRKLPEDSFKNVQLLTHLSGPEYIQVMSFFVESIGAEDCSACHNTDDFSSDEKEKKVRARLMIKLVQHLNPMFFNNELVTCYTCHRGTFSTRPLSEKWRPTEDS